MECLKPPEFDHGTSPWNLIIPGLLSKFQKLKMHQHLYGHETQASKDDFRILDNFSIFLAVNMGMRPTVGA